MHACMRSQSTVEYTSRCSALALQISGESASSGTAGLVVTVATIAVPELSDNVTLNIGTTGAAVTLLEGFADDFFSECFAGNEELAVCAGPGASHHSSVLQSAGNQTVQLRLAYSDDTSLLIGSDYPSAATVTAAGRRLLDAPQVSGALTTTVVSGKWQH